MCIHWILTSTIPYITSSVYNRKREKSVTLVYHLCAKFSRGQIHANMSESACGQLSMCSHTLSHIDDSVTSIVEWGVDLLWHMRICTKGREPLPGMVYSMYAEWDSYSPLLSIVHF